MGAWICARCGGWITTYRAPLVDHECKPRRRLIWEDDEPQKEQSPERANVRGSEAKEEIRRSEP